LRSRSARRRRGVSVPCHSSDRPRKRESWGRSRRGAVDRGMAPAAGRQGDRAGRGSEGYHAALYP
jgi:hypothetical protein